MENLRPGRKMSFLSNLMPVVLLIIIYSGSWSLAGRLGPHKNCLTCKDGYPSGAGRASRDPAGAPSTTVLASGEPCGVYTLGCGKGLRCVPPPREHSPLQALLQGRGFCAKQSRTSPTEKPRPTGKSFSQRMPLRSLPPVTSLASRRAACGEKMQWLICFKYHGEIAQGCISGSTDVLTSRCAAVSISEAW